MSDGALLAGAAVVALCGYVGLGLSWYIALAAVAVAVTGSVLWRHPVAFVAALALVAGVRSTQSLAALDAPLPRQVAGMAQLVSDPTAGDFATTVELSVDGRRWQAQVERADEWVLRPLLTGDHVEVVGRPTPMRGAPEGWRRSRHLAGRLVVAQIDRGPPARPWYRLANGVHRVLARGADSFDDRGRALYLGLVVGDDRDQSDVEQFRFQATGLGHLLAVSGQNVAFLLLLARPLLSRVGLRSRWLLGLAVLVVFVLVTRAEPSVLRAATMAAVALLGATSGREMSGIRVVAIAVIALVLVDPLLVRSLGFQLSLCATTGLLVAVRPLSERLRGPRWFADALACTIVAQLATAPLLFGLNGGVPSIATVANVAAVPVAGVVMVLGLTVGLVAGVVVQPVASVLMWPVRLLVAWISGVAEVGSRVPAPLLGTAALLAVIVAGALLWCRPRFGVAARRCMAVGSAVLLVVALWPTLPPVGDVVVSDGVALVNDPCGRTVVLKGRVDVGGTLSSLQRIGVVRADAVVGPPGRSTVEVAEQLVARLMAADEGHHSCGVP